jgi:hypothetical protein
VATPQRFGILRHNKKRPLLTRVWHVPTHIHEKELHQTTFWHYFLSYFGLPSTELNLQPFPLKSHTTTHPLTQLASDSSQEPKILLKNVGPSRIGYNSSNHSTKHIPILKFISSVPHVTLLSLPKSLNKSTLPTSST